MGIGTDLDLCPKCNGAKKIAPMGGIFYECKECMGIGYIKGTTMYDGTKIVEIPAPSEAPKIVIKKKMGRPKRISFEPIEIDVFGNPVDKSVHLVSMEKLKTHEISKKRGRSKRVN